MSAVGVSTATLAGIRLLAAPMKTRSERSRPMLGRAVGWRRLGDPRRRRCGRALRRAPRPAAGRRGLERGGTDAAHCRPGAAMGELALLAGAPAPWVQAIRDTTLLELRRDRFAELMERNGRFAAAVARELASQLQASGGLAAPATGGALRAATTGPEVPLVEITSSLAGARAVRPRRGPRGQRGRNGRRRAGEGGEGPRAAARRSRSGRVERPVRPGGRPHGARRDGRQPAAAGSEPGRRPRRARAIIGEALRRCSTRLRRASSPGVDGPADPAGPARAPARRARTRRRALGRRRARLRAHRRPRRAGGGRDQGRPLRRLLDGVLSPRWPPQAGAQRASATAVARSWSGARRQRLHDPARRADPLAQRRPVFDRLFGGLTVEELAEQLFTVSADRSPAASSSTGAGKTLIEAVGASMSIPGLAPPASPQRTVAGRRRGAQQPAGRRYGGRGRGADRRRSTSCGASSPTDENEPPLPSIMETLSRERCWAASSSRQRNRDLALLVLTPRGAGHPARDFGALERAIEGGRAATRRALDEGARDKFLAAVSAPVA